MSLRKKKFFLLEYLNIPSKGGIEKTWRHSEDSRCVLEPNKLKTSNSIDDSCFSRNSIKKVKDFNIGDVIFIESVDYFSKISSDGQEFIISPTARVWRKAKILKEINEG